MGKGEGGGLPPASPLAMGHGAPSRAWQTSGLRWGQGLGSFALYNLYIIYTVYFVLFVLRTTYCLCAFCTSYFVLVLAAGGTATAARQHWGSGPQPVPRFSLTKRGSRRGALLCGALTNSPAKQSAVGRPKPHHPLLTPLPPHAVRGQCGRCGPSQGSSKFSLETQIHAADDISQQYTRPWGLDCASARQIAAGGFDHQLKPSSLVSNSLSVNPGSAWTTLLARLSSWRWAACWAPE
jgi:hypothetical protein